jgi:1,4-dihydroxy-2-naphthoate octaprenyltransferase
MTVNFSMWKTALWGLVKMEKKEEWDKLDVISKWLIATRSAVTTVTLYACVIAGLLAWRDGHFNWMPWVIVTLGLFIAHGTNNFLNDYTDFSRGVDKDNYFRTQYGVHPLVQGFWTKRQQLIWFFVSGVLAFAWGVCALLHQFFAGHHRFVCIWCGGVTFLYLAAQIPGAGRAVHLPDLGPDPGGGRIQRAGAWLDAQ